MEAKDFIDCLCKYTFTNYIGVPDSTLSDFCKILNDREGKGTTYIVAPNEGSATAMAIGDYLSTGKSSCVFMQNSGIGNMLNPLISLANKEIYGIPMLFIIGWRGEYKDQDEPQHAFQGRITLDLLKIAEIDFYVIDNNTSLAELEEYVISALNHLKIGKQYALVIRPGTFSCYQKSLEYDNGFELSRFEAIKEITNYFDENALVISTTGKISRELLKLKENSSNTFFCVGGMGHASAISVRIAQNNESKRVYCLDGDGASLMHMGNIAFIGNSNARNLIHFVFNNQAHESVGGLPTKMEKVKYSEVAKACKYSSAFSVANMKELNEVLVSVKTLEGPVMVEIFVKNESNKDLPRPKDLNTRKNEFMSLCVNN